MKTALVVLAAALPAVALAGDPQCQSLEREVQQLRSDVARLQASVDQLKDGQRQLLSKLGSGAPQPGYRPTVPDPETVYAVPVVGAPARGDRDAWVTIVEVADFQCPFCGRVSGTVKDLLHKYGSDVRLVYLHNALPFHQRARPAAIAATCAQQQGQFWAMHDVFYANQRALDDSDLERYAHDLSGLDFYRWKRCLSDPAVADEVDEQAKTAQRFGARGTPSFFINGRSLTGAQPRERFEVLIDAELKKAKASGIPRGAYYQKAVLEEGRSAAQ